MFTYQHEIMCGVTHTCWNFNIVIIVVDHTKVVLFYLFSINYITVGTSYTHTHTSKAWVRTSRKGNMTAGFQSY